MDHISTLGSIFSNSKRVRRNFWPAVIWVHHFRCSVFKSHPRFNPQEKHLLHPSPGETAALCYCTLLEPHFTANIMRAKHNLCQWLLSMQEAGLFIQRSDTVTLKYKGLFSTPEEAMKAEKAYMWQTVAFLLGLSIFILTILNQNSWFQGMLQDLVLFLYCQKFWHEQILLEKLCN